MKNGFALIELLAVIVILAIIALIATPIVLNIINDVKESEMLRSGEFYLDSLEFAIANRILNNESLEDGTYIIKDGDICLNDECSKSLLVEIDGETPKSGEIIIIDGNIYNIGLLYKNKYIVKSKNQEFKFPCTLISGSENAIGSKYECEVSPDKKYNFYVLSHEVDGTTNLIMERNICEDGSLATASNKCTIAWQTSGLNTDGPVTVMDYLYNTTKNWINIPNIIMNYEDEGNTSGYGYGKIITDNNVTRLTKYDGNTISVLNNKEGYYNLKARLIFLSESVKYDESLKNEYLYDFLMKYNDLQLNPLNITGYWTLASRFNANNLAVRMTYYGYSNGENPASNTGYGIRPVINIKL